MTRIGGSATEGAEGILEFPGQTRADVRMALWEGGGCFAVPIGTVANPRS